MSLNSLRRRWWGVLVASTLATGTVGALVARQLSPAAGGRWFAGALAPVVFLAWFLRRTLPENRPPDDAPGSGVYQTLGLANGITVARGWLYACLGGFVLVVPPAGTPWRWLPAVAYSAGIGLDWVDGATARTVSRRTRLGERLDLAFDTMGFLLAPVVGVVWGALPVWYLSVSAARYLFKLGCWLRERRGLPVGELPESRVRRPLAALQMLTIAVALVPPVPASVSWPLATAAMIPTLVVFLRDYLSVTGRRNEANAKERTPVTRVDD
ncbi:CDP-alcohol phosphatidyltransferase family protein [Halosegnis rubeus]|jgi:CDP-diacylglycerol--glycerol-3-phosphate 3-phosphatidyltransferase|uniref:CDP-alcohol phosphatidyltransferase family protein n=1 Tax=Halosegnis rubeus TaxID=2212850 RepID=A0A5N5U486_9EURY|nr:CDP-alcohol phosphatidyltransferase family protein [Halosegnis rubeus]KAB7512483.1 CDP-alcohol phosphatidyltransferase family protein [Halosegnis rubeus]KAB7512742.1 CDP-alcohol phosphatidyltransferase family protein [Halosegnis rubeus]KAB7514089.1 CDP-alcohol phosphatidyltransferase family protein [Halosegnis rubeus]